ncbi:MAG: hypothetical protein A2Y33_07800 [Spirochaetes bacterium GWF1_51_8]|nr:MAG: hypothetical protein A2Y33_07800 [Spirochaetes bacterium GWF1_51_8]
MDISKFNELLGSLPELLESPKTAMALDRFIRDMSPKDVFVSREHMKKVLLRDQVLATHFVAQYLLHSAPDGPSGDDHIGKV